MVSYFGFVFFVTCFSLCQAVAWRSCGSGSAIVGDSWVSGCHSNRCKLIKNTNATLKIPFTPTSDVEKVTVKVSGVMDGVELPFPLENDDGCVNSGLSCPIEKDKEHTYVSTIFINRLFPSLRVNIKYKLEDQSGSSLFCVMIPAQIE